MFYFSVAEDRAGLDYGLLGITKERVITKRNPTVSKSSLDIPKVNKHKIPDAVLLVRKEYHQKVDPFDQVQPAPPAVGPSTAVVRPEV